MRAAYWAATHTSGSNRGGAHSTHHEHHLTARVVRGAPPHGPQLYAARFSRCTQCVARWRGWEQLPLAAARCRVCRGARAYACTRRSARDVGKAEDFHRRGKHNQQKDTIYMEKKKKINDAAATAAAWMENQGQGSAAPYSAHSTKRQCQPQHSGKGSPGCRASRSRPPRATAEQRCE